MPVLENTFQSARLLNRLKIELLKRKSCWVLFEEVAKNLNPPKGAFLFFEVMGPSSYTGGYIAREDAEAMFEMLKILLGAEE